MGPLKFLKKGGIFLLRRDWNEAFITNDDFGKAKSAHLIGHMFWLRYVCTCHSSEIRSLCST